MLELRRIGAAGGVFPLAFGIIRDEFPREKVAAAIGLISATFGIGGGVGLILSGVIVDNLSYHWVYWIGLVVVLMSLTAVMSVLVPAIPRILERVLFPRAGMLRRRLAEITLRPVTGTRADTAADLLRRVVVDRGLSRHVDVVLDAGVHDTSLRLAFDDLVAVAGARLADIAAD